MVVTPYKNNTTSKKQQVAEMFNSIAHRYDFLNHFLSLGIDVLWRRKAVGLLQKEQPKKILDIATGTGDFAIEALKLNPEKIIGIDIAEKMLQIGIEKIKRRHLENKIELMYGDSEDMPFDNNTFDAITTGFGVRNFEYLEKGLYEIYRVIKDNGTVAILEFSKPKAFPFKQVYHLYFTNILPSLGRWISKDGVAYSYLPASVNEFPEGEEFLQMLERVGFRELKMISLTFGIAAIYFGRK